MENTLEAEVDIILPNRLSMRLYFSQLIEREGEYFHFLLFVTKQYCAHRDVPEDSFIVSDADITDGDTCSFAWSDVSTMAIPGMFWN